MDGLTIDRVAPSNAAESELVERVATLINAAYIAAEHGLWHIPVGRTHADEVREWIAAARLVAAWVDGTVVGSVTSHLIDPVTGWFGALAVDLSWTGRGIASGLVRHAEREAAAAGAVSMQLELLQPEPPHGHQERLRTWYSAIGYRPTGRLELAEIDANAVDHARFPLHAVVMRKALTGASVVGDGGAGGRT